MEIKLPSQRIFVLIIQWLSIITQQVYLLSINYLKSSNEKFILVAELNEEDWLGKCLCTLMENMVKPKEKRIELTEVIKQLTTLLPAERKISFNYFLATKVCENFLPTFHPQIVSSN